MRLKHFFIIYCLRLEAMDYQKSNNLISQRRHKSFGKRFCLENALVVLEINSVLNLINMNSHVLKTATVKSSSYKLKFCPDKDLLKIFLFHLNSTASFENEFFLYPYDK
jgi:hypothetical protein